MKFQAIAFWALLPALLLSSCVSLNKLEHLQVKELRNVQIDRNLKQPIIAGELGIHNPNSLGFRLVKVKLQTTLNGKPLAIAQNTHAARLAARKTNYIPWQANVDLMQFADLNQIADFISGRKLQLGVSGQVTASKFIIFRRTYQIQHTEQLDLRNLFK